jgi:hypothetical protein
MDGSFFPDSLARLRGLELAAASALDAYADRWRL